MPLEALRNDPPSPRPWTVLKRRRRRTRLTAFPSYNDDSNFKFSSLHCPALFTRRGYACIVSTRFHTRVVCEQNAIRSLLTSPNGKIQILPKPRDLNGDFNRSRILISETIIITITTPHAPRRCCIIVNNEACNVATMSKRNLNLPRERKSSSSKNRGGGGGGLSTFVNYVPRE